MDTKKTQLAIIIPTYDSLDTLKVLVKQVYKLTTGDFRVYVIDDGQKESTIQWLKGVKHPNFKVNYHPQNKGVAPSWNDGLRMAEEDGCTHFAIFNDDIEIPPYWWDACLAVFAKGVNLVGLDAPCPIPLTGWFFILDRKCLERVGYFDEQFAPYLSEDDDYYLRFKKSGLKFIKIPLPVFHHGSKTIIKLQGVRQVALENWRKLQKKHKTTRLISQL